MKRETRNANARKPLPLPTLHSQRILKKVPVLPELAEGSQDLANAVVQAFSDTDVKGILMYNLTFLTVCRAPYAVCLGANE